MNFDDFFKKATGLEAGPYPFQRQFAEADSLFQFVNVPTGLGKTAMAILGWLWRRFHRDSEKIPRRLVYCLPTRVLVEQTTENARKWCENLCEAGALPKTVPVYVLMGGEEQEDWAMWPEREAILIGTQDMLLSRALNRGYASSRARWPMEFGLLNNDCLWVFDEIQLMGPGLATTAQLEAFRNHPGSKDRHGCRSVWMSATMQHDWLKTVDFNPESSPEAFGKLLELTSEDRNDERIRKLQKARKPLLLAEAKMGDSADLAEQIVEAHKRGTRTIAIVNTVKRARELYKALPEDGSQHILLHSRFRPDDRKAQVDKALADPPAEGMIIISTQVVEAGVDISATTLFTEVAPWSSLVQRFGRCNRNGLEDGQAQVFWIDLPKDKKKQAPYEPDELKAAAELLQDLKEVGIESLAEHSEPLSFQHSHVIRRRDIIDLFDTTPDLAGNDIDIDRFIRDVEQTDVRVFWRDYGESPNETETKKAETSPRRDELCPVPFGEFKEFFKELAKTKERKGKVWRWDFLERKWEKTDAERVLPGQVYLVDTGAGGYTQDHGWELKSKNPVEPVNTSDKSSVPEAYEDDRSSQNTTWETIAEHTNKVCEILGAILDLLTATNEEIESLRQAARWHDRGKAHEVFCRALPDKPPDQG
ncbi:MAG: CRISPR-associated helicase Cas3', partial [Deltaproteobacteria bacterium]|nr:CRISPR-associated helicase Cas3' [Deltaproteobacteria bacterium]